MNHENNSNFNLSFEHTSIYNTTPGVTSIYILVNMLENIALA